MDKPKWKDTDGDGVLEDQNGHPISFSLKTNSNKTMRVAFADFIKDDLAKMGNQGGAGADGVQHDHHKLQTIANEQCWSNACMSNRARWRCPSQRRVGAPVVGTFAPSNSRSQFPPKILRTLVRLYPFATSASVKRG